MGQTLQTRIKIEMLGQSGCKMEFPQARVYIDPYLSNSVEELDGPELKRLVPINAPPEKIADADWVLITHEHIDHCDPHTLPKLAMASPQAQFMGPEPVLVKLRGWGVENSRLHAAREEAWQVLGAELSVRAIPAAHPEIVRDQQGCSAFVGYLFDYDGKRIYHAGDTSLTDEILDRLKELGPIHSAFLPVNEQNFFRNRRGIIGNMSVREAFGFASEIGAEQVIPVHWDMFSANETTLEEIRAVYYRDKYQFSLLIRPRHINLADVRVSIVIRTLNEAKHLDELLTTISRQVTRGLSYEVIVVDSGSSDATTEIAERHGCRLLHIAREEFSFGRSLNIGCEAAQGDLLVIVSGHCVPIDQHWLQQLCQPLVDDLAAYSYGRQLGGERSHFSEKRILAKYYPKQVGHGQNEYFCNNANAALRYEDWEKLRFDEEVTGLEDMALAKRLVTNGRRVKYVPEAIVYHYHEENWAQVMRRYEREAVALRHIMPQIHVSLIDVTRYIVSSVYKDWMSAIGERVWRRHALDILRYRWYQYRGVYKGNNLHRLLSHEEKDKYFFPE